MNKKLNIKDLIETLTEEILLEDTDNSKKFHLSSKPIEKIEQKNYKQKIGLKPDGFWYSCGDSWIKWLKSEWPDHKGEFYYEVLIDESKILKLTSSEEIINFTKKYGVPNKILDLDDFEIEGNPEFKEKIQNYSIDWNTVSKEYSGVEFCPYIRSLRRKLGWYFGIDISSGCIWDTAAIIKLIPSSMIKEEIIGTSGGVRYYQLGGSLPDHLYNKTNDGKPTRDPGVAGLKKSSRKRGKMKKSSEDKPGKKEKRWYEKEAVQYKSLKAIFEEVDNDDILVEYPGDPEKENTPSRGVDGEFPFLSQVFYHGTNKDFGAGDYVEPPSITDNISEKGRKKNLDKVFFTLDKGSARIYAGRAVQSAGTGSPQIYTVQPMGDVEWVNKTPGTTVLMAPQARVIEKVE